MTEAAALNARAHLAAAGEHSKAAAASAMGATKSMLHATRTGSNAADQKVSAMLAEKGAWGAIKGVAVKHPVTAFVAATGAAVIGGKMLFGKHTADIERRRTDTQQQTR